jgi:hypothetical protein
MFAAALSGMRAEATGQGEILAIDYRLVPSGPDETPQKDWRKWVGSDSSFEDERDCPVFFQDDIPGFGSLRLNSACTQTKDDALWP